MVDSRSLARSLAHNVCVIHLYCISNKVYALWLSITINFVGQLVKPNYILRMHVVCVCVLYTSIYIYVWIVWSFVFYALKFTTRRWCLRAHSDTRALTYHADRIYMYVISNWMCACEPLSPPAKNIKNSNKSDTSTHSVRCGLFWSYRFGPYLSIDVHKNHNFLWEKLVKKCWHKATIEDLGWSARRNISIYLFKHGINGSTWFS